MVRVRTSGDQSFRQRVSVCIAALVCVFATAGSAHAVSDSFLVQTLIRDPDILAPSVPANLVAVPVATSQINLSWDASSDDVAVAGYHIFRDSVLIATTSGVTYADTGLAAGTMYTYYLTAFDGAENESVPSASVSATTLTPVIPPENPPASGQSGTRTTNFRDLVTSLSVYPDANDARIAFTTGEFVRAVVRWGRTSSYELGSLGETTHATVHGTHIAGLEPSTTYYFVIEGETQHGRYGVLYAGTFVTEATDDVFPPGNVTGLRAEEHARGVLLSWDNPLDADFEKVRIIGSDRFYPVDIADGWMVYEGAQTSALDTTSSDAPVRYYTVFSYDALGNISSGAVVRYVYATGETSVIPLDPSANALELARADVRVMQEGVLIPWRDGTVHIDGTKQFSIALPYAALPEHLKTILAVVERTGADGVLEQFSFLLRVNRDRTGYVATVDPFGIAGDFLLRVSVFDFKTSQVGYVEGAVLSYVRSHGDDASESVVAALVRFVLFVWWFPLVLLFVLVFFLRRRHESATALP